MRHLRHNYCLCRQLETLIIYSETRTALTCIKRKRELEDRFRRIRAKAGKVINRFTRCHHIVQELRSIIALPVQSVPKDAMYIIQLGLLESERLSLQVLKTELSQSRNTLSELEREARARSATSAVQMQRPTPTVNTQVQGSFVTGYPGYSATYRHATPVSTVNPAQVIGTLTSASTGPASSSHALPTGTPQPANAAHLPTPAPGFIPVQLPITSLPSLTALGILPVSAAALPAFTSTQSQPTAILRGVTSEGRMMNIEINVSMLQPAQTSGLAVLLNSIMTRSGVTASSTGAPVGQAPSKAVASAHAGKIHVNPNQADV
jgi:hypothetical protein